MEIFCLGLLMMLCFEVETSTSQILQRQKRNWIIDSFIINESYTGPFPYLLGTIKVEKSLTLFRIEGDGVDKEPKNTLRINELTGELYVYGPVDHEKFKSLKLYNRLYPPYHVLQLKFQAQDQLSQVIDTRLGIEIQILDENDNAPEFERKIYQTTIDESTIQGTEVITISASDKDSSETNQIFTLKIVSIEPRPQDLDFYLTQISTVGKISFKGCLDHEKAEKYTITVEAKDHGEPIRLSSSATVIINIKDGNNHLPVITNHTGPWTVKEGQENLYIGSLQVADDDTQGTDAWKAKFEILEDTGNNFKIITDYNTNVGHLYVQKPLNYEDGNRRKVMINVDNKIPYFSCKVESRSISGLWKVSITSGKSGAVGASLNQVAQSTFSTTVIVMDVNEPPTFDEVNKSVRVQENGGTGKILATFTARDPDMASANKVLYRKGDDPNDLITVDSRSGNVTLLKTIDRESPYVKDNFYVATIVAVDNGEPPMTSTATLSINVMDENDNAPSLYTSTIDVCQSSGSSLSNITALDLDENPYGGPFNFKLLGNSKGKWKIDPEQGFSANLVKENIVPSGHYMLSLEVSDLQGKTAVHNLTVTVCNCLDTARPNCKLRKSTGIATGNGAIGALLISILLLPGLMLLAFTVSCKKTVIDIPYDGSGQQLMKFNTEVLGSDCQSIDGSINNRSRMGLDYRYSVNKSQKSPVSVYTAMNNLEYDIAQSEMSRNSRQQGASNLVSEGSFAHRDPINWSIDASIIHKSRMRDESRISEHENWSRNLNISKYESAAVEQELRLHIHRKLCMLHTEGAELGDFAPHVYAEEGMSENDFELDSISIHDNCNLDFSEYLDFRFNTLASICMPIEST